MINIFILEDIFLLPSRIIIQIISIICYIICYIIFILEDIFLLPSKIINQIISISQYNQCVFFVYICVIWQNLYLLE
jgi:hypothetical protein